MSKPIHTQYANTESTETIPAMLYWVEYAPTFASLKLGRIELAQITQGILSGHWFYTLRFNVKDEKQSFSTPTRAEAEAIAMEHARKIIKHPSQS